jgi:hypothetical protein
MSLTDMKMSKKEAKREHAIEARDEPRYPYGLTLNLDKNVLDKLGIDKLPEVGDEMIVAGIGVIESAHEHSRQSGKDRSVSIQLQKLEVGPLKEPDAVDAVSDAIEGLA